MYITIFLMVREIQFLSCPSSFGDYHCCRFMVNRSYTYRKQHLYYLSLFYFVFITGVTPDIVQKTFFPF